MMQLRKVLSRRAAAAALSAGMLFQLGGCNFGQVSTTFTLDGRELIISLVRTAIINPLDMYITDAINNAFSNE
ncbi:MAG: hypothetical protein J5J06_08930 [Phycisphaerae bacterium]|nr:hypothetical protein [Phycisphaerae bacterium]